jgi:type VI secretion system protein ImpC
VKIPSIPFKILALAQFLGPDCPVWEKSPLQVDLTSLDHVIQALGPACTVSVPGDLHPEEILEFKFEKLKDFHPDSLLQDIPALRNLWEARSWLDDAVSKNLSPQEINARLAKWPNLPPIRIDAELKKPDSTSRSSLENILEMVAMPDESPGPPSGAQGSALQIDAILKQILGQVFFHEAFRTMEASWRGLSLLLRQMNIPDSDLRIEIVPVCFDSLYDTLNALTKEVIDTLPSLVLIDLPFDNSPRCLELLESIASFSETLLVPAITWVSPAFFYIDNWNDIKKLSYLPNCFEESSYAKWQSLRKAASARWLAVTCNRFLTRYPYGKDNKLRLIQFEEQNRLWISPVWALGSLIGLSFAKTGWPTQFTRWENISLEDLSLNTEDPKKPLPTEAYFDRNRTDQFIRSGIIPLSAMHGKDIAFTPDETTVGGVSLSSQLFVSRITQLILWCRDHLEKGLEGDELEAVLGREFALFWESSGHSGPENLEISAGKPTSDGRISLHIALEPSRQVLPSRDKVELDFFW